QRGGNVEGAGRGNRFAQQINQRVANAVIGDATRGKQKFHEVSPCHRTIPPFSIGTPNREKSAGVLTRNTPAAFSALPTAACHDRKSPARSAPVRPDQAVSSYWRASLRRPGCSRRPARHG